jgi:hypothetical protein
MRRCLIIVMAFALLPALMGIASSQEKGQAASHKGAKGLSFSVSGLSSVGIGQYEGGIGGRYWISKKLAIISSLGVSAYKTIRSSPQLHYEYEKITYSRFSLFAGVEDHFFIKNEISPYLGGGIRLTTSDVTEYPSIPIDPYPGTLKKEKTNTNTFGIRGFCGIEYFFANWVSLSGQYQIDYFYERSTDKRTLVGGMGVTQPEEGKYTSTTLGLGTSALVATFYIW